MGSLIGIKYRVHAQRHGRSSDTQLSEQYYRLLSSKLDAMAEHVLSARTHHLQWWYTLQPTSPHF